MIETVTDPDGSHTCPTDPGEPTTKLRRVSVTDQEAEILAYLVAGRNVLEIGTGLGVATRAMAKTARLVWTVDIDEWVQENVWPDLVGVTTVDSIPTCYMGFLFDVAFIDGDHAAPSVRRDIESVLPLLVSDGFIILHDAHHTKVWDTAKEFGHLTLIPTHHGLGLLGLA